MSEISHAPPGHVVPEDTMRLLQPAHKGRLLLGLGLATGMEFYTNDSMNLILPDIAGSLGVSFDEASWILTTYSGALFLSVPVSIWMAGHFGYKRFLLATTIVYAIASMGCAIAPDLGAMLFWRAIQGFAGGGLYVWWRASIYLLMPKPDRSPALMRVSTMLYLSSALGLIGSGYITDNFNWRLIFLPNLLYAAGAIVLLLRYFPHVRSGPEQHSATDYIGIATLAAALIGLQVILSRGPVDGWFESPSIHVLSWIAGLSFLAFVFWQSSPANRAPLLHVALMRDRNVLSSALLGFCTGMILSGSLFALPEYLRNVASQPHSATRTGLVMCTYALVAVLIRPFVPLLVSGLGQRKTIVLALLPLIVSMLSFSRLLTAQTPDSEYLLPLALYGLCLAPLLPAVGSGTVARIEQNKLLDGVSLYMTFRQFGAAIGVAVLTILINWRETLHSTRLFDHLRTNSPIVQDWLSTVTSTIVARSGNGMFESRQMATGLLAEAGKRQAETLAYADAFVLMALVGALALGCVLLVPPTPPAAKPSVPPKQSIPDTSTAS